MVFQLLPVNSVIYSFLTAKGNDSVELGAIVSKNLFISMYLLNVFTTIVDLADKFADLTGYIGRIGQLIEVLDSFDTIDPKKWLDQNDFSISKKADVEIMNLTFAVDPWSQIPIIKDFNLDIFKGEHVVIHGQSGCGKSTLLKVLAGLWEPISGYIKKPDTCFFLPQTPYLICAGSLREQITYPNNSDEMSDEDFLKIVQESEIEHLLVRSNHAFLENTETSLKTMDWTDNLSSGERQRISFARLLWRRPVFAFLDEATVHLGKDLEERLMRNAAEKGITFIAVSHHPIAGLKFKTVSLDEYSVKPPDRLVSVDL